VEDLEQDKDALLRSYVSMVPGALGASIPEERRRVYAMLRLRAVARPNGALEIGGALGAGLGVCGPALSSRRCHR
jgi:hypothetical protein